jgi:hypothetical protein
MKNGGFYPTMAKVTLDDRAVWQQHQYPTPLAGVVNCLVTS